MDKKRALVVDDNDLFRESVSDLLEEAGFQTVLAASAEEAVKLAAEGPGVDVILCDLVLPTDFASEHDEEFEEDEGSAMVGVGAIHRFKERYPGVPVIAMSGVADRSTLQAMSSFGASEGLQKPFSFEELAVTLKRVVQ